jgi:hypothetical protein
MSTKMKTEMRKITTPARDHSQYLSATPNKNPSLAQPLLVSSDFSADSRGEYTDDSGHAYIDGIPWRAALAFTLYVNDEDFGTQCVEEDGQALTAVISD